MPANLGIFGSPIIEVELFDLTNGAYSITVLESADFNQEPYEIELADGNKVQYGLMAKLEFTVLATNQEIVDELKKRASTKQTIQAKSLDGKVTLDDVFIQMGVTRGFKGADSPHVIKVVVQKIVDNADV